MTKIVFKLWQSPGDCLVATAAIRLLHNEYSDCYITDILTPYPEIFYRNPYITNLKNDDEHIVVPLTYENYIGNSDLSGIHFSDSYVMELNKKLGLKLVNDNINPELYLTEEEKDGDFILSKYNISGKFWLFNAGFKIDMPLKSWPIIYWEHLLKLSDFQLIQVGSSKHVHPIFSSKNCKSLVGSTENLRDYLVLCYHSEGHIGPISLCMHIMASYNKPCIVIAGGRENPRWEMYQNHAFLHTVGMFSCCKTSGCWNKQRYECTNMDTKFGMSYPKCMWLLSPDLVADILADYN